MLRDSAAISTSVMLMHRNEQQRGLGGLRRKMGLIVGESSLNPSSSRQSTMSQLQPGSRLVRAGNDLGHALYRKGATAAAIPTRPCWSDDQVACAQLSSQLVQLRSTIINSQSTSN